MTCASQVRFGPARSWKRTQGIEASVAACFRRPRRKATHSCLDIERLNARSFRNELNAQNFGFPHFTWIPRIYLQLQLLQPQLLALRQGSRKIRKFSQLCLKMRGYLARTWATCSCLKPARCQGEFEGRFVDMSPGQKTS